MKPNQLYLQQNYVDCHVGINQHDLKTMLASLGQESLDAFVDSVLPDAVVSEVDLSVLPNALSEADALARLEAMAAQNQLSKNYIGCGYYPSYMPAVILRNVLENPGWYTAYTPYQAEVAQGRLEAMLNFQQMCIDLTGLEMAGASLLDEATAAAEAMTMARRVSKSKSTRFFVDERVFAQTLDVVQNRAKYFGFEIVVGDIHALDAGEYFGALLQYVGDEGDVVDLSDVITTLHERGALVAVAADVMSLVWLKSPAAMGADVALGSTQRFGLPMGFGGPHAAYFAFKKAHVRAVAGRIIGVSRDAQGRLALRMALQTREQHIRREKANSNICTSQALLANLAGMYAVYYGEAGLKRIAGNIHRMACVFAATLKKAGFTIKHPLFFDTVTVVTDHAAAIVARAKKSGVNLRLIDPVTLSVAFYEGVKEADLAELLGFFDVNEFNADVASILPASLCRQEAILTHEVFCRYHTEHEFMRYLKYLEDKDIALNRSMIALGSCTMKLNAAAAMIPISWRHFADMHPFAPPEQTQGYQQLIQELTQMLAAITQMDAVSFQPNSGAMGEYSGLLAIRRYLAAQGQSQRDVCLIPRSAHGTNPASAHMLGLEVVTIKTDEAGNIDVADFKARAAEYSTRLAALMVTYPSTHGVFENSIKELCQIMHEHGAQVYMDGANMNAQVGLMAPGLLGADVVHMNLHKTFSIPHGGGGPGVGAIGLKHHLAPYAPGHRQVAIEGVLPSMAAVAAAPYGSASILPITWMYLTMMGAAGLRYATKIALLNANYVAAELKNDYPILYVGQNGRVAHECIIDLRPIKSATGITEVDIAKRLADFGFHAPTMSFPVPGTLMVEPTESESLAELNRFIAAMRRIKVEAEAVAAGRWPHDDNPLVNAPHPAADLLVEDWTHPYSREEAAYPLPWVRAHKYWPPVARVDDVYGDRNLQCTLPDNLVEDAGI